MSHKSVSLGREPRLRISGVLKLVRRGVRPLSHEGTTENCVAGLDDAHDVRDPVYPRLLVSRNSSARYGKSRPNVRVEQAAFQS